MIVATFGEVRRLRRGRTGLVPTMGFLHEGHISLLEAARAECDHVVMSLFVNPLQFDEAGDLQRYPRDLERDAAIAEQAGVDVLLAPDVGEMYAKWPPDTVVKLPGMTAMLEGAFRPGHFDGVATVVTKLFAGVQPDLAYFGRKDGQQLAVVRALGRDLSLPVDVRGLPTIRERDGLALSSRNVFLSPPHRAAALALSGGLMAAGDAIEGGLIDARTACAFVRNVVSSHPAVELEYVEMATQDDVTMVDTIERPAFLSLAAKVGDVRLIDNIHIDAAPGGFVADRGVRLDRPSVLYAADEASA